MTTPRSSRLLPAALLFAFAAHLATFLVLQPRLQPWYFDREVGVERNAWNPLITDAATYGLLAAAILREGAYTSSGEPIATHMPGTAWLLALSKRSVGNLVLFGVAESLVLFLGTFAYARAAARLQGGWPAAIASLLFLLHPLVLVSSWTVNSDALHAGFFLGSLALLMRADRGAGALGGAGASLGLACWFREVACAEAIGAAVGLVRRRPPRARAAVLFLGVFLLALAPWVVRNFRSGAGAVLTTSKAAEIFYICSFGLTLEDVNPFDIDEGGAISLTGVNARAAERLRADGFGPESPPGNGYFVRTGLINYLAHPLVQARSFAIKATNLLRPPVARRHLAGLMPPAAATAAWAILAIEHLLFVWVGLWALLRSRARGGGALGGALVGAALVSLAIWTEPRYLIPFYLPLALCALQAMTRRAPSGTAPAGPSASPA